MKRLILSAMSLGLALTISAEAGEAQVVRVGVGVHVPRVDVRFDYGPQYTYPVRRIHRQRVRRLAYERDYLARLERERYRAWLDFEYRRWLRQHRHARYRNQLRWEREFLRDQRRAERAYRRWLRENERDFIRDRERERNRDRLRDRERDRDRHLTGSRGRNRNRRNGG